eukprot:TRINITY_DN981_c0_g1_i1.p1 TRINITY_DN981_c0_g1~~TRINITY_DN981_c0_g1_i1.p1  ORF type:complete len:265 (+),score=88.94 TRINITY_DN981_c0_g1_i1:139-933(+)
MERFRNDLPSTAFVVTIDDDDSQEETILISEEGIRNDNRKTNQLRPIFMKTGIITQANGSTYIERNNTKLICSVYGPRPSKNTNSFSDIGFLQCEFKYAPFSCHNEIRGFVPDLDEKEISASIVQSLQGSICLEKYPKSVIDIYILVIENDGAVIDTAINAASLAIADSGIEMYDLISASTVANVENQLILDPTCQEEESSTSKLLMCFSPSLNEIVQFIQSGNSEPEQLIEGMDLCLDACAKMYSMMQKNLIDNVISKQNEKS